MYTTDVEENDVPVGTNVTKTTPCTVTWRVGSGVDPRFADQNYRHELLPRQRHKTWRTENYMTNNMYSVIK